MGGLCFRGPPRLRGLRSVLGGAAAGRPSRVLGGQVLRHRLMTSALMRSRFLPKRSWRVLLFSPPCEDLLAQRRAARERVREVAPAARGGGCFVA